MNPDSFEKFWNKISDSIENVESKVYVRILCKDFFIAGYEQCRQDMLAKMPSEKEFCEQYVRTGVNIYDWLKSRLEGSEE